MKITKSKLKQIILEELQHVLDEQWATTAPGGVHRGVDWEGDIQGRGTETPDCGQDLVWDDRTGMCEPPRPVDIERVSAKKKAGRARKAAKGRDPKVGRQLMKAMKQAAKDAGKSKWSKLPYSHPARKAYRDWYTGKVAAPEKTEFQRGEEARKATQVELPTGRKVAVGYAGQSEEDRLRRLDKIINNFRKQMERSRLRGQNDRANELAKEIEALEQKKAGQ